MDSILAIFLTVLLLQAGNASAQVRFFLADVSIRSTTYVVFLAWSQNGNGLGDEYALVLGGFNFFFLIADGEVVKLGGGPDDIQDCPNLTNLPKAVGTYFDKRAFLAQQ